MVIYTKEQARTNLNGLILRYEQNKHDKEFLRNESQIISSLIRPFVNLVLGWDTDDPSEYKVESQISGKRSDILVCSNGLTQFIIEAKSLAVDIVNNNDFYKQAMTYAYAKDKTFAILTNFRHFIILRCDVEIEPWKAAVKVIDLEQIKGEEFDLIYCFSKQFWMEKGEQNPLYSKLKDYKKRVKIDLRLLDDLKEWRQLLLNNILNHPKQNKYDFSDEKIKYGIEEEVQRLIDRIIFVCYTEDKGFHDPQIKLLSDEKKDKHFSSPSWLLGKIHELFNLYWSKYNSDLFKHGKCDEFFIEDGILLKIFEELRKPKDRLPYDIASIEADILGKTYENFIGHVISGEKRLKEKESKGKRKEMGIYYTPTYIVDYIVRNTVGEYIKGKPFSSINKVKILDPACGSGSFLIKAFDVLIEESRAALGREPNYEEKKSLLLNCIHGVDLDERAVDICKLNLSLKLAERGEKLPELHENIKCGNSLIDDENVSPLKYFKWENEFKDIMQNGRFDIVIGNPPYVFARENISEIEKKYYISNYISSQYQINTYLLFIEKFINLLKRQGKYGLIVPNSWLMISSAINLRKYLLENSSISKLINLLGYSFEGVNVETIIIIGIKEKSSRNHKIDVFLNNGKEFIKSHSKEQNEQLENKSYELNVFSDNISGSILKKIKSDSTIIDEISTIKAGLKAYEAGKGYPKQSPSDVKKRPFDYRVKHDESTYKYLEGRDVQRYNIAWSGLYLKYGQHLAAPRTFDIFNGKKLVIREITGKYPKSIIATYTDEVYLFNMSNIAILENTDTVYSLKYLLGILNSNLMAYYFIKNTAKSVRKLFPKIIIEDLRKFPIRLVNHEGQQSIIKKVDKMLSLNKKLHEQNLTSHEKQKIEEEIKRTDSEIDELVYKLYGITEEEKKIIEESLK